MRYINLPEIYLRSDKVSYVKGKLVIDLTTNNH